MKIISELARTTILIQSCPSDLVHRSGITSGHMVTQVTIAWQALEQREEAAGCGGLRAYLGYSYKVLKEKIPLT